MRLLIQCNVPADLADPDHHTGVTEQGHEFVTEALQELGFEDLVLVNMDFPGIRFDVEVMDDGE